MLQVTEKVWNGSVNTKIVYGEFEYLLQAKRIGYFPLLYPQIVDYFSHVSGSPLLPESIWLEYDNVPLKWNMPVGVLHDLLHLPSVLGETRRPPWTLELKAVTPETPYPSADIIPVSPDTGYAACLQRVFVNSLKQSCYVINGNSKAVMSLSEDDSRALWCAISHHDYATYKGVSGKIRLGSNGKHSIPIKLYLAGSSVLVQAPVSATTENAPTTLNNVISEWMPRIVSDGQTASAYIHGVSVTALIDLPVLDVWEKLRHLDNFLYVVMIIDT